MTGAWPAVLAEVAALRANWDGEGAIRPFKSVLERARSLSAVVPPDLAYALSDGGVKLYWDDLPSGYDLLVEIDLRPGYLYMLIGPNLDDGSPCEGRYGRMTIHRASFEQVCRLVRLHSEPPGASRA